MKGPNSPLLARLLGIVCLLTSAYGVLLLSRYTADSTRRASITAFRDAITEGHFQQGESALQFAANLTRITDRLPLPPLDPHSSEDWSRTLKKAALFLDEFECLSQPPLKISRDTRHPCSGREDRTPFTLLSGESREQYFSTLTSIRSREREISELRSKIAELSRGKESAWTKIDLLRGDYGELFNLPEDIKKDLQKGELFLYESGVLTGLPTLPKVQDNLQTYVALAEALAGAGLPLPKVSHEQFNTQLLTLKDSFSAVIETLDATESLKRSSETSLNEYQQEVKKLYKKAQALIGARLHEELDGLS